MEEKQIANVAFQAADAFERRMAALEAELRQWKDVFGHLGTADECGNEWIALQDSIERKNALLMRALLLCDWLAETPHQRGSINGLAAQLQHAITSEIEQ